MPYCFFNNEQKNEYLSSKERWIAITKKHEKSKEQTKESFIEEQELRKETLKSLNEGHVSLKNNFIKPDNIFKIGIDCYLNNFEHYTLYKINPIQYFKEKDNLYNNSSSYNISKFDVTNKINTRKELIKQLIFDYDIEEFLFYFITSSNLTLYFDLIYELFACVKELYEVNLNANFFMNKDLNNNFNYIKTNKLELDFIKKLIDTNIVDLYDSFYKGSDSYKKNIFVNMLKIGWYEISLNLLKEIKDKKVIEELSNNDNIFHILSKNKNEYIDKIKTILNFDKRCISLLVFEDGYSKDELVEKISFKDINEIKTYLIKNYDVSFKDALGDVENIKFNENSPFYGKYFLIE